MTISPFPAMVIEDTGGKPKGSLRQVTLADLPDNDVLVEISYSSLNYKDGLAITGRGRIARSLPLIAGIDLAGQVVRSRHPDWQPGDQVIVNGWGLSETEAGGYSKYQSIKAQHLTPLPPGFGLSEAMAIGTAGYTAALCALALEDHGLTPDAGEVIVTGAAGGVGTIAISLLAARGYSVTAVTGRESEYDFLSRLGAKGFLTRDSLAPAGKPLQSELWAGVVDCVGGTTLANLLAQTRADGAVAACGLAGGADLPTTVMPFILRGVTLYGINSVYASAQKRAKAWAYLDRWLDRRKLADITTTAPLSDLPKLAEAIIAGQTRGRYVIEI